jgi:asparagine synthase (glutamine-hydrolysing)
MHKVASVLGAASLHELQSRLVSQWSNPEFLVPSAGASARAEVTTILDISSAAQQMVWDTQTYLVDDILAKVDRASMSVGLEARVPLLDHRIVELAWEIPTAMNFRDGSGKWMLKRVLERYVPREFIDRPKMGFGVPVDSWLRGPLKSWAGDIFAGVDSTYIDRSTLLDTWQEHLSGRVDRGGPLWCVLMFESWLARTKSWV